LFAAKSAKARHLKDELAECKSKYANLEAMAVKTDRLHAGTLLAMEAEYVSRVSSLEDEIKSVVMANHAACQAAYA
jgi:DNA topoisomerase IB